MDSIAEDSINNGNLSEEERDEARESIGKQKSQLRQQINELKSLILQMKCNLDLLKFGNTKCNFRSDGTQCQRMDEIPNVDIRLENHLYRYSGFHCIKFAEEEYVFNFVPLKKYDKKHMFAVQILNKQGEGVLGKWVMPMAIDLIKLQSEIPLNNLKNVRPFLRICKHYVECYIVRDEQYTLLTDVTSHLKNCSIQTNLGYTQVILDLMGVYNENNDSYMNLIVYLLYHINETRPYKVVVDSMSMKAKLDKMTKKHLEKSLMCFKKFDLCVAFENMLNEKPFVWSREDDEDSPVPNDSDNDLDEEGFLESIPIQQRKSLTLSQSRKQRKENLNFSSVSKRRKRSGPIQSKKQRSKSRNQHSVVDQNTDAIESTSNLNNTRRRKLKQRKLNFSVTSLNLQHSTNLPCSEASTSVNKEAIGQSNKPFTSTPKPSDKEHSANIIVSSNIDISDITANGNNLDCVKTNDTTKQTRLKKNIRSRNNTPGKLLQSKMKKKVKYVKSK